MTRTKSWLIGGMTIGLIVAMTGSASAQLFRRSETREQGQRYQSQNQPQYQGQPRYQDQYQGQPQYQGQSQSQRGEVRYEGSDRYSQSSQPGSRLRHRRISAVIGASARGANGEYLGKVEDLVASEGGCIDYAIVSFSGLPGLGNKVAAIPWTAASFDMSQRVVTLDVERERIRQAPIFFDRNNWPDLYERDWTERVSDFFGVEVVSDSREHGFDRNRSDSRATRSRTGDRDRYESRSYERPESDSERDRYDSRSRRSFDREQSDYRSRRSQDEDYDRDRQQNRSGSRPSSGRYQDDDSNREDDYRSRDRKSDEDDSNKDNEKNDDSNDSDDNRPQ